MYVLFQIFSNVIVWNFGITVRYLTVAYGPTYQRINLKKMTEIYYIRTYTYVCDQHSIEMSLQTLMPYSKTY